MLASASTAATRTSESLSPKAFQCESDGNQWNFISARKHSESGVAGLVRKMPPQPGKKNVPNSTAEKTAVYYIKHFSSLQDLRIFFLVATSCHHLRHLRPSVRSILSTKPWPPWHLDKLWQGAVARQVRQCLDRPKATAPNVTCAHLQFRPLNEAPPTHLGSAPKRQEHPNVQRSSTCKVAQAFLLSLSLSLSEN